MLIFFFLAALIVGIYLLFKAIVFFGIVIIPIVIVLYILIRLIQSLKYRKIVKTLNFLTSPEVLKVLKKEDKKRLATLIYNYHNNRKAFKKSIKDDLLWAGIGYSVGTMGLDRAMRVGIGYTLLRKYVKPSIRQMLEGEDK